jgi:hypothetical protein
VLLLLHASSLAFVDSSVVNVGLPAIARSFPQHGVSMSWIVSGYLLPLSALLLLRGAAGDHPGYLRANGLFTTQLGPDQVIAVLSIEFADSMLAPQIEARYRSSSLP